MCTCICIAYKYNTYLVFTLMFLMFTKPCFFLISHLNFIGISIGISILFWFYLNSSNLGESNISIFAHTLFSSRISNSFLIAFKCVYIWRQFYWLIKLFGKYCLQIWLKITFCQFYIIFGVIFFSSIRTGWTERNIENRRGASSC